jgi:hypothetical protein
MTNWDSTVNRLTSECGLHDRGIIHDKGRGFFPGGNDVPKCEDDRSKSEAEI